MQKHADICKFKRALVLKGIFSEAFQVSSIILTSFRRGGGGELRQGSGRPGKPRKLRELVNTSEKSGKTWKTQGILF